MPPLVRRYLKAAIVFLTIGLLIGGWMLVAREFGLSLPPRAMSAHTHLVLVGFVMMMICGVALWMFPRPARDDTRYHPHRATWAYWCLTAGTSIRAGTELIASADAGLMVRTLIVAAGLSQLIGLLLFFWTMLPRIRSTIPHDVSP